MSSLLTDLEKVSILFYLGYSVFEDDGTAMRSINSIDSKPLATPFVRDILQKLKVYDEEIYGARPLTMAIQDGSIHLRAHYTIENLCRLARQQVCRLANFLKISVNDDMFSPSGKSRNRQDFYAGDPSEARTTDQPPMKLG